MDYVLLSICTSPIRIQNHIYQSKGFDLHSDDLEKGESDIQKTDKSQKSTINVEAQRPTPLFCNLNIIDEGNRPTDNGETFYTSGLATQVHQELLDI